MSKLEVNTIEPQCGTNLTLGANNDTISLGTGAAFSGGIGAIIWETTPQTGSFQATKGKGYFMNTTSGALTLTTPASPSAGDIFAAVDYAETWQTNNLTISPHASAKIGGVSADATLDTKGQSVTFVYVDAVQGWINTNDSTSNVRGLDSIVATGGTITTSGDYKIHTFTGPGTFTVCSVAVTAANNIVSYMVVAGGGGAGGDLAGGGGAGGFREYKGPTDSYTASPLNGNPGGTAITVSATGYPIGVGAGGARGTSPSGIVEGCRGTPSTFSTITSTGGGAGMVRTCQQSGPPAPAKSPGGSGGGGSYSNSASGTGNTPPVSPAQGKNGGTTPGSTDAGAGGGGGATVAGGAGAGPTAAQGAGGAGATTSINGTPTAFAGGGGGGAWSAPSVGGAGGAGGGGAGGDQIGSPSPNRDGTAGTDNTGGGGGGANADGAAIGGKGGSGIVIIRYKFQ